MSPTTIAELADAIRSTTSVIPIGSGTKPRLSDCAGTRISTRQLSGIIEYEPSEFTFTARAGTPVSSIQQVLGEQGQHLPFDPMLVEAGATIGGTVAAGLNGPGRLRYGGIRDFILGVRFVDGEGRVFTVGGKVVKNAAGFDLPKFFVGSLGRFGVLAEMTFKVFPSPEATATLELDTRSVGHARGLMQAICRSRFEPRAVEYAPESGTVLLLLGAPRAALDALTAAVLDEWPGRLLPAEEAQAAWRGLREFAWAHPEGTLIKLALTPDQFTAVARMPDCRIRISAAGDQAFLSFPGAPPELPPHLHALTLRGSAPLLPGARGDHPLARRVKAVLDPANRFPSLAG